MAIFFARLNFYPRTARLLLVLHIWKIFVRGGGKLLHCEIYQQDIVLSENKVGLSMRVVGPSLPPRKTLVITGITNTTFLNL